MSHPCGTDIGQHALMCAQPQASGTIQTMPLNSCDDCGHDISPRAWRCPNCGNTQFHQWNTPTERRILIAVGLLILVVFIGAYLTR